MPQPIDAIALQQSHGAGIEIGPHRLGAVALGRNGECLRKFVEGIVPGNGLKAAVGHLTQRLTQTAGVVHALSVTRHLGTDNTRRVAVVPGAMDPADSRSIETLDLQRTSTRTIVRTG